MDNFRNQIKKFIVENGLIATIAGVGLGIITKDVIQSLVADIIIPVIIINFVNNFVSWVITIIITFFFITYSMKYLLNIDTSVNNKDKK